MIETKCRRTLCLLIALLLAVAAWTLVPTGMVLADEIIVDTPDGELTSRRPCTPTSE